MVVEHLHRHLFCLASHHPLLDEIEQQHAIAPDLLAAFPITPLILILQFQGLEGSRAIKADIVLVPQVLSVAKVPVDKQPGCSQDGGE